jgi:hypothetical protein
MLTRFYFGMVVTGHVDAKAASRTTAALSIGGRAPPYRSRLRREEQQTKAKRLAVVLSLFLALLAAALLVGGRKFIDPLLEQAAAYRQSNQIGDVVFAMPDGRFCRHLSFDNKTAELIEGAVEQCAPDRATGSVSRSTSFRWGGR